MNPEPSLDTGLLVGRQNVLPRAQRDAVPAPGVEIEDALGLGGKRRITREDPTAMPPRAEGVRGDLLRSRRDARRSTSDAVRVLEPDEDPRRGRVEGHDSAPGDEDLEG